MFQILVVEDDLKLCELFCTVLTDNGYTAISTSDGIAAFDILENTHIDLIISDIMMPKMDGFELTKSLRKTGYTMPILIITAKENATNKRKGFQLGTDDYMVKPWHCIFIHSSCQYFCRYNYFKFCRKASTHGNYRHE